MASSALFGSRPFSKIPEASVRRPMRLGGETDIGAVEAGSLKQHRVYIVRNLGVLTAHDTGDVRRAFSRVADHQDVLIQLAFLTVQGLRISHRASARRTIIS